MSVLAVDKLCKSFGGVHAVNHVSFTIGEGEFLALIGPNGAGKSTCFNMINGQLKPDSGRVLFQDKSITGSTPRQIWRLGVGRTFQIAATFGSMTVAENVQMALLSYGNEIYSMFGAAYNHHHAAANAQYLNTYYNRNSNQSSSSSSSAPPSSSRARG